MSNRYRLPGNKTLIDLDGNPTDDRKSWESARWKHVTSLPGFEVLAQDHPEAVRTLRRVVRHPKPAHGAVSLTVDHGELAKDLGYSGKVRQYGKRHKKEANGRKTVGRHFARFVALGLLEADRLERGRRGKWLPRVYHFVGAPEELRWHRPTLDVPPSDPTVMSHRDVPLPPTGEHPDGESELSLLAGGSSSPSLILNGQDEVGNQADVVAPLVAPQNPAGSSSLRAELDSLYPEQIRLGNAMSRADTHNEAGRIRKQLDAVESKILKLQREVRRREQPDEPDELDPIHPDELELAEPDPLDPVPVYTTAP